MIDLTLDNGTVVPIDCVLFDNDGTLVDTREILLRSFRHAADEVLHTQLPDEVFLANVGIPLIDQMRLFSDDPETVQRLFDSYHAFNVKIHDEMVRLFPGIADALELLHRHDVKLGVVTSKRHALAVHGLEILGVGDYFDVLVGADDWPEHKPAPGPVAHACELLEVDPARCAYVGDSPFDMKAGNGAGCVAVAAEWGMFEHKVLAPENPAVVCATVDDFIARCGA